MLSDPTVVNPVVVGVATLDATAPVPMAVVPLLNVTVPVGLDVLPVAAVMFPVHSPWPPAAIVFADAVSPSVDVAGITGATPYRFSSTVDPARMSVRPSVVSFTATAVPPAAMLIRSE